MPAPLPKSAQAVIIGGGIVGVSVAYHLTQRGWRDVVLLEQHQLTAGTTWHAAGLVSQLPKGSHNLTVLGKYAADLFHEVERTTGLSTGFVQHGSITIATNDERWEEIRRTASSARNVGIEARVISAEEATERFPYLDPHGVRGAIYLPADAVANPTDATMAIAAAARAGGAQIFERTPVAEVLKRDGEVLGIRTADAEIATDVVVNCAGIWAYEVGRRAGVNIPLHAAEHFYVITEPIPGLPPDLPYLRCLDEYAYIKVEAGKLLVGFFEPGAKPWATRGIPEDAAFVRLGTDWEHIGPYLQGVSRQVPILGEVGYSHFFNGPEAFTPDDRYMIGEAPELRGYFVATGFNSVGVVSAGGAGRVLADWIIDGHPPMDLWAVDIRRFTPQQGNRRYLHDRTTETLGLLYDMHWPYRQFETARGVRRTPLHDRLAAVGACFGELAGWERANWFAPAGVTPRYEYSFGRQNWFEHSAAEHRAVRERVGLFDQSSFGKILVQGRDAEAALNGLSTANVAVEPGRIVYTQWLNERGGVEADLTITRLSETEFLVVTYTATLGRNLHWLRRHIGEDARCTATDVTSGFAVLGVMGPRSRDLLAPLTDADLSNAAFPFRTSRQIDLGYTYVRASRISFVGELGWELYIPAEMALHVYDTIVAAGEAVGLRHAGFHAQSSLRLEKAYREWGHDMTDEDSPLEAGLTATLAWDKPGGFIGRDSLLRQRERGRLGRRLCVFTPDDPRLLLLHDEPIWRDGVLVGRITSAGYGHTIGRAIGLGYVSNDGPEGATPEWITAGTYELEIASERYPAHVSLRPLCDPRNERLRM